MLVNKDYHNMKLVHWPLMGALLYLVQRGRVWAGCGPDQTRPRCTKYNSAPINGQCTNFILFDVALSLHCKELIARPLLAVPTTTSLRITVLVR